MTTSVKLCKLLIGVALLPFLTSAAQFSIRQREDLRKLKKMMMSKGSKGGNKVAKDAILDRCMNLEPRQPSTTVQSVADLESIIYGSRQGLRRNELVRVDVNLAQGTELDCSSSEKGFATLKNQCVFISGGGTIPKDCFLRASKDALISLDNVSLEGVIVARHKKKRGILLKDAIVTMDCSSSKQFVPQTAVTVQGKTGFHVCGGLEDLMELVDGGWFDFESISDDAYVRLDGYFDTPVVDILNRTWPVETPQPSSQPSDMPSNMPSDVPSDLPSAGPSVMPSNMPSVAPSDLPSAGPSAMPSNMPIVPSELPSTGPSATFSNVGTEMVLDPTPSPVPPPTPAPTWGDKPPVHENCIINPNFETQHEITFCRDYIQQCWWADYSNATCVGLRDGFRTLITSDPSYVPTTLASLLAGIWGSRGQVPRVSLLRELAASVNDACKPSDTWDPLVHDCDGWNILTCDSSDVSVIDLISCGIDRNKRADFLQDLRLLSRFGTVQLFGELCSACVENDDCPSRVCKQLAYYQYGKYCVNEDGTSAPGCPCDSNSTCEGDDVFCQTDDSLDNFLQCVTGRPPHPVSVGGEYVFRAITDTYPNPLVAAFDGTVLLSSRTNSRSSVPFSDSVFKVVDCLQNSTLVCDTGAGTEICISLQSIDNPDSFVTNYNGSVILKSIVSSDELNEFGSAASFCAVNLGTVAFDGGGSVELKSFQDDQDTWNYVSHNGTINEQLSVSTTASRFAVVVPDFCTSNSFCVSNVCGSERYCQYCTSDLQCVSAISPDLRCNENTGACGLPNCYVQTRFIGPMNSYTEIVGSCTSASDCASGYCTEVVPNQKYCTTMEGFVGSGCPCDTNEDCSDGFRCFSTTNTCQQAYTNGGRCTEDNECLSKLCRDPFGEGPFCLENYEPLNDVFFREKALRAMELSGAAYKDKNEIEELFRVGGKYNGTACADDNRCVSVYDSDDGLDRAVVVRDPGRCYIAFRGTDLTDADDKNSNTRGCFGETKMYYDVGTGCGFRAEACYPSWLQDPRLTILPLVHSCLQECKESNNDEACELVITGHSQGGCQATAATYALSQALQADLVKQRYTITFGAPPAVFEINGGGASTCEAMFAPFEEYIFNFVNTQGQDQIFYKILAIDPIPFKRNKANCFNNLKHVGNSIFLVYGSETHIKYFDYWNNAYTDLATLDIDILTVHRADAYRGQICTLFMGDENCDQYELILGYPAGDFKLPLTARSPFDVMYETSGLPEGAICAHSNKGFADLLCETGNCDEGLFQTEKCV